MPVYFKNDPHVLIHIEAAEDWNSLYECCDGYLTEHDHEKLVKYLNGNIQSIVIEKRKYRASLFMIHSMLKTMGGNEIAETLEISYDLLKKWNNEKTFKALMYSNYKEFLIYLGDLYM